MEEENTIRYKVVKGKKRPLCDYNGDCQNLAYREVYPSLISDEYDGWSYLCKKHFEQEQKKFKGKLPNADVE